MKNKLITSAVLVFVLGIDGCDSMEPKPVGMPIDFAKNECTQVVDWAPNYLRDKSGNTFWNLTPYLAKASTENEDLVRVGLLCKVTAPKDKDGDITIYFPKFSAHILSKGGDVSSFGAGALLFRNFQDAKLKYSDNMGGEEQYFSRTELINNVQDGNSITNYDYKPSRINISAKKGQDIAILFWLEEPWDSARADVEFNAPLVDIK